MEGAEDAGEAEVVVVVFAEVVGSALGEVLGTGDLDFRVFVFGF